jgi:hypothetical protein
MKFRPLPGALLCLAPALAAAAGSNAFNPDIALVLSGIYSDIQHDPDGYTIPGFTLPDGSGPGTRGFGLGESELAIYANIDPDWYGMFTYSMHMDNTAEVENAFVQTTSLGHGLTVKAGRFYSGIGYLNEQHSHTWDFVDVPLAYQVFLGSQLKDDGIQVRWLAPTDMYTEFGAEWMNGSNFPAGGSGNHGRGTYTAFVHIGDDVGFSNSWRAGLSLLHTRSVDRTSCADAGCSGNPDSFTGTSRTLVADFVWKWAPNGNVYDRNFKLQAEYLRQSDSGDFTPAGGSALPLDRNANGWYVQGEYQFIHGWRAGLRYDRLHADDPGAAFAGTSLDPQGHTPSRDSIMVDYTNSEFSRIRLQYNHDNAAPVADNQWYVQYIMALGAHPAHIF